MIVELNNKKYKLNITECDRKKDNVCTGCAFDYNTPGCTEIRKKTNDLCLHLDNAFDKGCIISSWGYRKPRGFE
jgi:hypothetical protein